VIDKRPSGRWQARYRDPEGRLRSQTFDRKADAEGFLTRTDADIQRGEWIDPALRRVRFEEWAELWWVTTVRLRPTTSRGYWQTLHNYVLPYFGHRHLAAIDYMDVERFIAAEFEQGELGPKKIRDCVSVVSLVMKAAVRSGARRDNPAAGHHVTVRRRRVRQGDVLGMEQVHALVEHVRDPYKPAIWLLVLTGMRPAELCGLKVRSVDLARHRVSITETLLPVSAYADQPLTLVTGPPKTDAGDRAIPIPPWLSEQLAASLAARAAQRTIPIGQDEPLFVNRVGKPLNRDKFRETVIRPALVATGLPATTRTYDLRHAHASMLIDLGANVLAVAQRTGHSDPSVTLREYGHLFEGVQEDLSEQLDRLRAATATSRDGEVLDFPAGPSGWSSGSPIRLTVCAVASRRARAHPERQPVAPWRRRGRARRTSRSFFIPSREERESLDVGALVRLFFFLEEPAEDQPRAERMWLEVTHRTADGYVGLLTNHPRAIRDLALGDAVAFGPEHVIAVNDPRWAAYQQLLAFVSRRLLEDDRLLPGYVCHDPSDEQRPPKSDGSRASGWQLLVGDETDAELDDVANCRTPNLAWIMERSQPSGSWCSQAQREVSGRLTRSRANTIACERDSQVMRPTIFTVERAGRGRVSTMARPRGGDWLRDELLSLQEFGVAVLVSMLTAEEVDELELREEPSIAEEVGLTFLTLPTPDRGLPQESGFLSLLDRIDSPTSCGSTAMSSCPPLCQADVRHP
jgi:integrase